MKMLGQRTPAKGAITGNPQCLARRHQGKAAGRISTDGFQESEEGAGVVSDLQMMPEIAFWKEVFEVRHNVVAGMHSTGQWK
jgi:hypothetical protein